jgi:hypothetical protein
MPQDLAVLNLDHLRTEGLMNSPSLKESIRGSEDLCLRDACVGVVFCVLWVPETLKPPAALPWHSSACGHHRRPARTQAAALRPDAALRTDRLGLENVRPGVSHENRFILCEANAPVNIALLGTCLQGIW